MTRITWIVGGIIVLLAIICAIFLLERPAADSPVPPVTGSGNAQVGASGASTIVTYTDSGFSPSTADIGAGTTVTWSNESSKPLWVEGTDEAVDSCSTGKTSGVFDECAEIGSGGSYSYTFSKAGTFSYRNHSLVTDAGTVVVSESSSQGTINPNAIPE